MDDELIEDHVKSVQDTYLAHAIPETAHISYDNIFAAKYPTAFNRFSKLPKTGNVKLKAMLTAHLGFRVVQTARVLPRHPQLVLAAAVLRPEHYHGQCPALGLAESLVHPRLPHERKHVRHADPDGKRRFGIFRETSHVSYVAVGCAANELGNAFEVSGAEWSVGGVIVGGNEGIELSVGPDAVENHLLFERGKNI